MEFHQIKLRESRSRGKYKSSSQTHHLNSQVRNPFRENFSLEQQVTESTSEVEYASRRIHYGPLHSHGRKKVFLYQCLVACFHLFLSFSPQFSLIQKGTNHNNNHASAIDTQLKLGF